jgi:hypothetical protein
MRYAIPLICSIGADGEQPCFDMKDSVDSPLLGEEIGRNPEVVCYMPLTPQLGAVFFQDDFSEATRSLSQRLIISPQRDVMVRNQNTLVIQQAEKIVVASKEEEFIFKIASKRKRGR